MISLLTQILQFPGQEVIEEDINAFSNHANFSNYSLYDTTPADIINTLLYYIFTIAGIILLFMLISGGFTIFVSAGNPEKIKKGTTLITNALIGFFVIFSAYWIIQVIEWTLGIKLI